ncbi:MAG: hypothetical protein AAF394_17415, partial [Planctomycetota bacterium]
MYTHKPLQAKSAAVESLPDMSVPFERKRATGADGRNHAASDSSGNCVDASVDTKGAEQCNWAQSDAVNRKEKDGAAEAGKHTENESKPA